MQILMNIIYLSAIYAVLCSPLWAIMALTKFLDSKRKTSPRLDKCLHVLGLALQGLCETIELILAGLLGVACAHFIRQSNASYRKELYKDPKRY